MGEGGLRNRIGGERLLLHVDLIHCPARTSSPAREQLLMGDRRTTPGRGFKRGDLRRKVIFENRQGQMRKGEGESQEAESDFNELGDRVGGEKVGTRPLDRGRKGARSPPAIGEKRLPESISLKNVSKERELEGIWHADGRRDRANMLSGDKKGRAEFHRRNTRSNKDMKDRDRGRGELLSVIRAVYQPEISKEYWREGPTRE